MARARFSGKKGSFEPSCEVGYRPGCFSTFNIDILTTINAYDIIGPLRR